MKRTRNALILAGLGTLLVGCSMPSSSRPTTRFYQGGAGDGLYFNVGYGDALGAQAFGTEITLAKAREFGDFEYANAFDDLPIGEE
ncbi:MAG: hypothetical protein ACF8SC_01895 [Phycisphaerales bacterium JB037]